MAELTCNHCGKEYKSSSPFKKYCGDIKLKTGCAYLRYLRSKRNYFEINREKENKRNRAWKLLHKKEISTYNKNYQKTYRERFPDRQASRKRNRKRQGLSAQEYEVMSEMQENKCAICGKVNNVSKTLCVDHDHGTNRVRGLLCNMCNLGLGHFRDNIYILEHAIKYLKGTRQ